MIDKQSLCSICWMYLDPKPVFRFSVWSKSGRSQGRCIWIETYSLWNLMTSFSLLQKGELCHAARPRIPQYYFCFCGVTEVQSLGRRRRQLLMQSHDINGPVLVYLWNFLSQLFRMWKFWCSGGDWTSKYLSDSMRETEETGTINLRKFSDLKIAGSWEKTLRKYYICLPCSHSSQGIDF